MRAGLLRLTPHLVLGWWLSIAAVAAAPQVDPQRRPMLGRVLTPAGEPLAAAAVTMLGARPDLGLVDGECDVVQAVSDARGRFRVDLLVGRAYCGWANGTGQDAAGQAIALATVIEGWHGAGAVVEWRTDRALHPIRVRLEGGAAWDDLGPLAWVVYPTPLLAMALPIEPAAGGADDGPDDGPDGRTVLPPVPRGAVTWGVLSADGVPLHLDRLPPGSDVRLTLPPPRSVPVTVTDEAGKPIAGAELHARVGRLYDSAIDGTGAARRWRHRRVGVTDEAGRASVLLPLSEPPFASDKLDMLLGVRVDGRAETYSGFAGRHLFRDDRRVLKEGAEALSFSPPTVEPVLGSVRVGGAPRLRCRVHLSAIAKLRTSASGYTHDERHYEVEVDERGDFAIDRVPADLHGSKLSFFDQETGAMLCELPMREGHPGAQALAVDLANAAQLRVSLLDDRRGPAAGCVGYVRPVGSTSVARRDLTRFCTDHAGRAELPLWTGDYYVFAAHERGLCFGRVALGPGVNEVELLTEPHGRCRGVVHDAEGQPVAGAQLRLQSSSSDVRGDPDRAALLTLARSSFGGVAPGYRTDHEGRFDFPYLQVEGFTLRLQFSSGRGRSDIFEPGEEELTLVVR